MSVLLRKNQNLPYVIARSNEVATWQSRRSRISLRWIPTLALGMTTWAIDFTATPLNLPLACEARPTKQIILRNCGRSFLFLLELIAKILCAVEIARTSEALGNTQTRVAVASAPFEQYYAHSKSNLSATRAINSPLVGFSLGA